jgi:hypothetical protein
MVTEQMLDVMFAKARAAFTLGQQFTLELADRRVSLTVTADRVKIAEAHYSEQVRLATEEENRAGLAASREALDFENAYAAHVVEALHDMRARKQALAEMDAQLEGGSL